MHEQSQLIVVCLRRLATRVYLLSARFLGACSFVFLLWLENGSRTLDRWATEARSAERAAAADVRLGYWMLAGICKWHTRLGGLAAVGCACRRCGAAQTATPTGSRARYDAVG